MRTIKRVDRFTLKEETGEGATPNIYVYEASALQDFFSYTGQKDRLNAIKAATDWCKNEILNEAQSASKVKKGSPVPNRQPLNLEGDAFKESLATEIESLAERHEIDLFEAICKSMEVLGELSFRAVKRDAWLKKLYDDAKKEAMQALIDKIKEE